jgi:hypothetical protein
MKPYQDLPVTVTKSRLAYCHNQESTGALYGLRRQQRHQQYVWAGSAIENVGNSAGKHCCCDPRATAHTCNEKVLKCMLGCCWLLCVAVSATAVLRQARRTCLDETPLQLAWLRQAGCRSSWWASWQCCSSSGSSSISCESPIALSTSSSTRPTSCSTSHCCGTAGGSCCRHCQSS